MYKLPSKVTYVTAESSYLQFLAHPQDVLCFLFYFRN